MILILCLALCLSPLSAWAEEFDITDEAAVAELNHKGYEANRSDVILSRYKSVALSAYHPLRPETDRYLWETADSFYEQYEGYARYDRDNIFYEMRRDGESGKGSGRRAYFVYGQGR